MTLFDKYGGRDFWADTVDIFYQRILADPQLEPYFRDHDVGRVQAMNTYVLESTLGYANEHFAVGVTRVHSSVLVQRPHFHRYLELLLEVLKEKEVEDEDIAEVYQQLKTYEPQVVQEK